MLMPMEYALISQFLIFNFLYFADATATMRGWAPEWYSTYRFVLTFIVGASIVASLVARGRIAEKEAPRRRPEEVLYALRDAHWEAMEAEEQEKLKRIAEEEAEKKDDKGEGKDNEIDDSDKDGEKV
jgi:hypothetical protein